MEQNLSPDDVEFLETLKDMSLNQRTNMFGMDSFLALHGKILDYSIALMFLIVMPISFSMDRGDIPFFVLILIIYCITAYHLSGTLTIMLQKRLIDKAIRNGKKTIRSVTFKQVKKARKTTWFAMMSSYHRDSEPYHYLFFDVGNGQKKRILYDRRIHNERLADFYQQVQSLSSGTEMRLVTTSYGDIILDIEKM